MAFTDTPKLGVALGEVIKAADVREKSGHRLGSQVFGSDGKLYVYAQANATIAADTAVATVNATTFLATASGSTYKSPPVAMTTGDRGWFAKASV